MKSAIIVQRAVALSVGLIFAVVVAFKRRNAMRDLKTFDDLKFKTHTICTGIQAELNFPNGWGVSVVSSGVKSGVGGLCGSVQDGTYELAVLFNGDINSVNPVARGDVRGWLPVDEVSFLMIAVQSFDKDYGTNPPPSWRKQWDYQYRMDNDIED